MLSRKIKNLSKILLFSPLLIFLGKRSPIVFDEGFYILQSKWILNTGDWITPMYWGNLHLDRTIGIQYLIALSQKIFGENNFSIYIPNILAGYIMLFFTAQIHKELLKKQGQIFSVFILSTTFLWINYFHMATQDLVYSTIVTFGLFTTIKAYKTEKNIYFFSSGLWFGFAFMFKTYLAIIPLLALLPFLINSKIFKSKLFWFGILIGFIPFLVWSYKIIDLHGYQKFSGLYSKFKILSKNNNFTNPFYYYVWNIPLNSLPWSIFSIIGFLNINKLDKKLCNYFLLKYPLIIVLFLSLFSTKTPYYALQIQPLISINGYLGLLYILKNKNRFSKLISHFVFSIIPLILIFAVIYLNLKFEEINIETSDKIYLSFALITLALSWLVSLKTESIRDKLFFVILGPYLLFSISVQSGLFCDRSRDARIVSEEIIKKENLYNKEIEFIRSGPSIYDTSTTKIRIATLMPKVGQGLENIEELKPNQYAWTTISRNEISKKDNLKLINSPEILKPWKLILKE